MGIHALFKQHTEIHSNFPTSANMFQWLRISNEERYPKGSFNRMNNDSSNFARHANR